MFDGACNGASAALARAKHYDHRQFARSHPDGNALAAALFAFLLDAGAPFACG
jgi:hypothetical protein